MNVRKILIFPAGTEIGLEIYQSLKNCKEVKLFGAGQAVSNHAPFVYERYYELPSIHEHDWLSRLVLLCRELKIDYIFPAYDDVIVSLSENVQRIPAIILAPSQEISRITRSKSLTYEHLSSVIRVPRLYQHATAKDFPLVVKPDQGQGSYGVTIVKNRQELDGALLAVKDPIISEYLPGEEFTVDCFSDREQGVLFCGVRERLHTRNGIAVHTRTVTIPESAVLAQCIQERFQLRGAWFFQVKRAADGTLALLEVAPRIAGSMSTHRVKGINFPLLTIFEHERIPIQLLSLPADVELNRALCNRYRIDIDYRALYIDLDDTLLLHDCINLDALHLIYACINRKIPVILITRHAGNLKETLIHYRLATVFDEVIHVADDECKSKYIHHKEAIFVDDSFRERKQVHDALGIPTFDCSMIELLTQQAKSLKGIRE